MKRRGFITVVALAGLAAAAGASHAQQALKTYRIGMVEPVSAELNKAYLAAFRLALRDLGYVEGQNLILEHRSADGDASRFPALVSEVIALSDLHTRHAGRARGKEG